MFRNEGTANVTTGAFPDAYADPRVLRTMNVIGRFLISAIILIGPLFPLQLHSAPRNHPKPQKPYDGKWWLLATPAERLGFLEGASDCLTWVAHAAGFSESSEILDPKITAYFKAHAEEVRTPVVEVWQRVPASFFSSPIEKKSETWNNPHWYLNGLWWRQSSESERHGFLEGYLWCMNNGVPSPAETYSHPPSDYAARIDAYTKARHSADDEAIANILSRFKDTPARSSEKVQ